MDEEGREALPLASYGVLLGWLIALAPFGQLFLAATLAQLAAGKIDKRVHQLALLLALLPIILWGAPALDWWFFLFFLAAYFDERLKHRPLLPLAALLTLNLDYILSIALFDGGYRGTEMILRRLAK